MLLKQVQNRKLCLKQMLKKEGKPNLMVLLGRLSNPISTILSSTKFSLKPLLYLFIPVHTIKSERWLSTSLGTFDTECKIYLHSRLLINPSAKPWCHSMTNLKDDKCMNGCCLVTVQWVWWCFSTKETAGKVGISKDRARRVCTELTFKNKLFCIEQNADISQLCW